MDGELDTLFNTMAKIIYEEEKYTSTGGGPSWPITPYRALNSIVGDFFLDLYNTFQALVDRNINDYTVAQAMRNPNRIADYNYFWAPVNRSSKLSYRQKYWLAKKFIRLISILRHGNPFCVNGANTCHKRSYIDEVIEKYPFTKLSPIDKDVISNFEFILTNFLECIYFAFPGFSRNYSGPYRVGNYVVVIKKFMDLRPVYMWFSRDLNFEEYTHIGIYRSDFVFSVNFVGKYTLGHLSFKDALIYSCIIIDGKVKSIDEIAEKYIPLLEHACEVGRNYISRLSIEEKVEKYVDILYYSRKPLTDLLSRSWKPSKQIYEKAIEGYYTTARLPPLSDLPMEKAISLLVRKMDFRRCKHGRG